MLLTRNLPANGRGFVTELSTPPSTATPNENEASESMNLLFITHSGKSISSLENQNKREIARRAQQNAFLKRKAARQAEASKRRKEPPQRLFGDFRRREQDSDDYEPPSNTPEWPQVTSLTTGVDPHRDDRALSVRTYLDTSRGDPFNTGKVPMTPEMNSVFMWYFNVILPVVEPTQSEREDYSSWAVPLLSTEPALLYSLLACMAHDIEQATVVGFGPPTKRNMTAERLHYRIHAIQELNTALAHPKTAQKPSTLLAVHFLLWQEMFAGDECVHLDGVQRVLEMRGGFHGLQRKALEGVMLGCFWRAIRLRAKPLLPMVPMEYEVSEEEFTEILATCDPSTARIGEALLDPEMSHHFDKEMLLLLEDARKAWVCFELIGIHEFRPEAKRLASIMRVNIDHRLLSYQFNHHGRYRPIQEAIRQAFVTFSNAHYCVVQPSSKIARCLIEDLKAAVEVTDLRSCWGAAAPALLWVLFQGAHLTFGQRERPWFVTWLARVGQTLHLKNWIQVRSLLVRFYYVDRVFQESFRKVWEEVTLLADTLSGWFV